MNSQAPAASLKEYDAILDGRHMRGQWQYDAQLEAIAKTGPPPGGIPFLWTWDVVHTSLTELCDLLATTNTARRNVAFINPAPQISGTSHTLLMSMQAVLPGEIAWAHRHSINALRFVVDGGPKVYTVVDGEKCVMENNDLVLTPAYTWHDHHNESDDIAIWIDILDVPVLGYLRQFFFETLGDRAQAQRAPAAGGNPYCYSWRETYAALRDLADAKPDPYDGAILRYAHPITGGPTLPTIDCHAQILSPGFSGKRRRHTSSTVYYVIDGEGSTLVGDTELRWGPRDSFVIPNWMWHAHHNASKTSEAILFSSTDAPVLKGLGMYREERQ